MRHFMAGAAFAIGTFVAAVLALPLLIVAVKPLMPAVEWYFRLWGLG